MGHAVGALDSALGRDTTRGDARFLLGVAYQQLGRTDQAVRALELAVRIDSTRPDRLRALAQAYERSGRPPADIDHLYRRALGLQPASAWIRADYAGFLRDHGRREDAEQAYRAALAEQPNVAVAWFNLGTLLAEDRRLADASDAFAHAVHLDPSFGQALTQLLEINTTGNAVVGVRPLGSPLPALTVRERDPRAVQLTVSTEPGVAGVRFINVPADGLVQILKPDGTPVRALTTTDGRALAWDLLTDNRTPIAGGLYRAYVQGRDPAGRPLAPQLFYFGVVRQRVD
jgi:tetratricopeptide (TPR) repeat protein